MTKKIAPFLTILCCLFFLNVNHILAQSSMDYSNEEELIYDIRSRNFEKPIKFLTVQLLEMEQNHTESFADSVYIGMTTLLSVAHVQNGDIHAAENVLSRSINFLAENHIQSKLLYSLYLALGGIEYNLGHYQQAKQYYEATNQLILGQDGKTEYYAVVLSCLADCNRILGLYREALIQIKESLAIIEGIESPSSFRSKLSIYQKAGAVFYDNGDIEKAFDYTQKVYEYTKDNDEYESEYINAARNLAVCYLNNGEYENCIAILKELEHHPLSSEEKSVLYNNLYCAYYFLGDVENASKYCSICSDYLFDNLSLLYRSIPLGRLEDVWANKCIQLLANNGIIELCNNNDIALQMCYNNCIRVKTLNQNYYAKLRELVKSDSDLSDIFNSIKKQRTNIFGSHANDSILGLIFLNLQNYEQHLLDRIQIKEPVDFNIKKWTDVKGMLKDNDYAIELFQYSVLTNSEQDESPLRFGALIISNRCVKPQFVQLCTFDQLSNLYRDALVQGALGINSLYRKDEASILLYDYIWKKIDPFVEDANIIYISPVLTLQNINFSYLVCPDNTYLCDKYDIRMVTSTASIDKEETAFVTADAHIYGACSYDVGEKSHQSALRNIIIDDLYDNSRGTFGNLKWSVSEVDSIEEALGKQAKVSVYKGNNATEDNFRKMDDNSPSILHLSVHGFYLVGFNKFQEYFESLHQYLDNDNSLLYSGIILSEGSYSLQGQEYSNAIHDGIITAEEISMMNFSNTQLVVLSACLSGIGVSQEGYGGLVKAFKYAGAKQLLVSLWEVSDYTTYKLMTLFYKYLIDGVNTHQALKKAQQQLALEYPDPYYWAGFVLLN